MKKTSYIGKSVQDLQKSLALKRVTLRDFRFGVAGSKKNVKVGREAKKDIARIMTELNRNK